MTAPEFSRVLPVDPAGGAGVASRDFNIAASPEERAALARRFGLLALESLSASGRIEVFAKGRSARLTATLMADVVQACVITLVPVPAHVVETFTVAYDRDADNVAGPAEVVVEAESEDLPDPLPDAGIDAGEAVAEHLGLALDPYPRAPGAALGPEAGDVSRRPSPFDVLRKRRGH